MARRRGKKITRIIGACVLILFAIIVAMPLWLPWLLSPVAHKYGLTYKNYERHGYAHFAVDDLAFSNKTTTVRGRHIETLVPSVWLWSRWFGQVPSPALRVDDWNVTIGSSGLGSNGPPSVYTNYQRVEAILAVLREWLPSAVLTNGIVNAPHFAVRVPAAFWHNGTLRASVQEPWLSNNLSIQAVSRNFGSNSLTVAWDQEDLRLQMSIARSSETVAINGLALWLTNSIDVTAAFGRDGLVPQQAAIRGEPIVIPARLLQQDDYQDITAQCAGSWTNGQFQFVATGSAAPREQSGVPPIKIDLHARGDANSALVEAIQIHSPIFDAELSQPVAIQYKPPFITESVALNILASLDQQPWLPAKGRLTGKALVFPSNSKYPAANFQVTGRSIQLSNILVRAAAIDGEFRWPLLIVPNVQVDIDGITLRADGQYDLQRKTANSGNVVLTATNPREFLPSNVSASNLFLSATFDGPLTSLRHAGRITVSGADTPVTHPFALTGSWVGHHLSLTNVEVEASAGTSTISTRFAAELDAKAPSIYVEDLTLKTNEEIAMRLNAPTRIEFPTRHSLSVSSLNLTGLATVAIEGAVQWPAAGRMTNMIEHFELRLLERFVDIPLPSGRIEHLRFDAGWSNGPVMFTLDAAAVVVPTNQHPVNITASASGTKTGIIVRALSILNDQTPAVTGEGIVPLTVDPVSGVNLNDDAPLSFQLHTAPDSASWSNLAAATYLSIRNPSLSLALEGTWNKPRGTIRAEVDELEFLKLRKPIPKIEHASLVADITEEKVDLKQLRLIVAGQPIEAEAEMPLGAEFLRSVPKKRIAIDWKKLTARVRVADTELQPFARFLPELIAPEGRINIDLALKAGELDGVLRLQNFRTRPLPSLGPLRDVDLRARFTGHDVRIHPLDATLGGRQIRGEGTVRLPPNFWPTNGLPELSMRLWGTNVPLVRQPDAIIRADLGLEITNAPPSFTPLISGGINLRNSYYLSDLKDLVPGKIAGPKRRPPYFSITNEPMANWRLSIKVGGDKFIKVGSPLFRGVASTSLRLDGTLREPVALGEVRIASGRVLFPFAVLEVSEGFITLTSEDPYRPHLNIIASTRRIGYEIKLEVTGPADEPIVQFSSSPSLSPEQILLMITAGQMPTETARLSTQQRAQRVALFFGRNFLSELGFGGGDEERLTMHSGEEMTDTGKQTYEMEYRLNRVLSLVGEYDRFNDYNAGLKWRVYSK